MNARTMRAIELGATAFALARFQGCLTTRCERTNELQFLWTECGGALSARVFTRKGRVHLEVWRGVLLLELSRVTGGPDCEVATFVRGPWERDLMQLASKDAARHAGGSAAIH